MAMPAMLEMSWGGNESYWKPQLTNMPTVFLTSTQAPMFYTLNGWLLANNPSFDMCTDDRVMCCMGTSTALAPTPTFSTCMAIASSSHGNNIASKSLNEDNIMTLQMNATATGIGSLPCHVSDHLKAGIVGLFQVYPKGGCPHPELASMQDGLAR